jgi:GNAT superfamily N-acetyltransferase
VTTDTFALESADPLGAEATALLALAADEARQLYPEFFSATVPPPRNEPLAPRSAFLIARAASGEAVACSALRALPQPLAQASNPDVAELRRMFVRADWRGRGVGRALLLELEQQAIAFGYARLWIETGNRQRAAIALYDSFTDRRIAPWGPHANDPTSLCFEKIMRR